MLDDIQYILKKKLVATEARYDASRFGRDSRRAGEHGEHGEESEEPQWLEITDRKKRKKRHHSGFHEIFIVISPWNPMKSH